MATSFMHSCCYTLFLHTQFISCSVRGVFSRVFCDFGPEFTTVDHNGEEPVECFIGNITKVNIGMNS